MSRSIFLLILSLSLSLASATTRADLVLVLGDAQSEADVVPYLTGLGHTVDNPNIYYDYDPGVAADLSAYDSVIMLYGYDYGFGLTANASTALTSYIDNGGRFITTAWMAYSHEDFLGDPIFDRSPVEYLDEEYDSVWDIDESSAFFTGLSDGWSDLEGNETITITDPNAIALGSNQYGDALVVYTENSQGGQYIYLNHAMSYDTGDVSIQALTLLGNSVAFTAVPEPSSLCLLGISCCFLGLRRRKS